MTRIIPILLFCLGGSLLYAQNDFRRTVSWPDGTPLDIPARFVMTLRHMNGQVLGISSSPV